MAKAKKNIFQEFMQDDYVPEKDQYIVKYIAGRGNNLHEVEDLSGSQYLVSMPKKYRQTVWLKKHDCLVIDPVAEGNKVRGEIKCVVPVKNVINLIQTGEWKPPNCTGDNNNCNTNKESAVQFFKSHLEQQNTTELSSEFIPTDSDDESSEEEDDDEEEEDDEEEDEAEEDSEPIDLINNEIRHEEKSENNTTCT